tara:strand:+ start:4812 stop:5732 length:921 start_codon:yes stop_codon:yes gene_type:complete
MKLADKMMLFSRFLRDNKDHELDLDELLGTQKSYFQEQSRYWKDKSLYTKLDSIVNQMKDLSGQYNDTLSSINKKTEQLLRKEELVVLHRDYQRYTEENRTLELVKERANHNQEIIDIIRTDVGNYSSWHYAGVELNPSTGALTESMLACDPLYIYTGNIADTNSIRSKFSDFFAHKRLMMYNNLEDLPQNQFGTATSINCYEFWPIDPIKDEMRKVYNLLRPGGYFIFTYNDCEQLASLDFLAGQESYRSYNTRTLMTSMVQMLGFEIVDEKLHRECYSWMIVKKPGELESQKLSNPLVKVILQL